MNEKLERKIEELKDILEFAKSIKDIEDIVIDTDISLEKALYRFLDGHKEFEIYKVGSNQIRVKIGDKVYAIVRGFHKECDINTYKNYIDDNIAIKESTIPYHSDVDHHVKIKLDREFKYDKIMRVYEWHHTISGAIAVLDINIKRLSNKL